MIRYTFTLAILTITWLVWPGTGCAALYRCTDRSGATVYTDSPAQLSHCKPYSPGPTSGGIPFQTAPGSTNSGSAIQPPAPPDASYPVPSTRPAVESGHPDEAIPLQRVGNLFIVDAVLLGTRDARLIVDTGASHTVLSPTIARELGLLAQPAGQGITVKTAGGPVQADVVTLTEVRVGEAVAQNVLAGVFEIADVPPGVDGLLGLTFLSRFLVTIDAEQGEMHLRPRR